MAAYIALSVSESSVNIANNTSVVKVVVYYYGNGVSWNSGSPSGKITIGGTSSSFSHSFTKSTSAQYLGEYSKTVTHNSSGGGTVSISASFATGTTAAGTLSASKTLTLSTIPRVSTLSLSKTSVTADNSDTVTVTATKADSSFTDTITVSLGSYSQTVTSGTAFTIPTSWNNAITGSAATATVSVTTKSGSTTVGTATANLTVNVPDTAVPTISSITATEAVSSVKSNFGALVAGLSQLAVTVSASGAYGASISEVKTVFNGVTYTGSTFNTQTINKSGTLNMVVTVKDSRGKTATLTKTLTVYPYSAPVVLGTTVAQSGTSTVLTVSGAVAPVNVSGTNKNSKTLKVSYKSSSASSYSNETTISLSDWTFSAGYTFAIDSRTTTYDFKIVLSDKVSSTEYYTTTGKPVISRYAGGNGVTLFEEATGTGFKVGNNQTSEFEGNATFNAEMYLSDSTLEDLWQSVFG